MRFVGLHSKINQVRRLIIGALLISAGTLAGEKQNYLAAIGPTQLRFRVAQPEYDPAKVLPPLKMSDTPATNTVETETVTQPENPVASRPAETTAVAPEQTGTPEVSTSIPVQNTPPPQPQQMTPEARTESSQMTPQMLLRYFSKDGNREVILPVAVEFAPPPPRGNGSSAVYTSPPAQ